MLRKVSLNLIIILLVPDHDSKINILGCYVWLIQFGVLGITGTGTDQIEVDF
jgi:hypothetical protein